MLDSKSGLRVWIISNMFPSLRNPRFGVFIKNFVNEQSKLGISFAITTYIYGASKNGVVRKLVRYFGFFTEVIFHLIFSAKKYDIIYVHFPLQIAFLLIYSSKRIFVNFHGSELQRKGILNKILFKILKQLVNKDNVTIVSPSVNFKEQLNKIFKLKEAKYIIYPSGGINREVFKPFDKDKKKAIRKKLQIPEDKVIIGYTSSLLQDKDPLTLLESFKILLRSQKSERLLLLMVGSGLLESKILNFVVENKLQNQIILLPSTDQERLAEYFNIFDLFVFPSKRESLGLVGLEAMSCGKIVIAARNSGVETYIIDEKNGFLFKPGNFHHLTQKIHSVLDYDQLERDKIIQRAIETASFYESSKVNSKLAKKLYC